MLNWRPVIDYELREIEYEKRMQQLESEDVQLRRDDEQRMKQLKSENARLAELNSKLDAILFSSGTNSTPLPSTPGESETRSRCWMNTAGWT
jgi:hypothetical protein